MSDGQYNVVELSDLVTMNSSLTCCCYVCVLGVLFLHKGISARVSRAYESLRKCHDLISYFYRPCSRGDNTFGSVRVCPFAV